MCVIFNEFVWEAYNVMYCVTQIPYSANKAKSRKVINYVTTSRWCQVICFDNGYTLQNCGSWMWLAKFGLCKETEITYFKIHTFMLSNCRNVGEKNYAAYSRKPEFSF